ncbi:MAG: PAS domain-containing protein, partial [Gammaproteobacteria bacterium]
MTPVPRPPHPPPGMRALLETFDYAAVGLPALDQWDPVLRSAMHLMLDSAIPVRMAVGPNLNLFYNDAYVRFLEERHPAALGQPYYAIWPEIRANVHHLLERVLAGEAVFVEEMELSLVRQGRREQAWFSYTFAPVRSDQDEVLAIYGACIELTAQKRLEASLAHRNAQLQQMFKQAPGFISITRGPQHVYEFVNDAIYALMGQRDYVGARVADVLPELAQQGFLALLDGVVKSGEPYVGRGVPVVLDGGHGRETRYVNFVYQPIIEPDGSVSGVFVEGNDVTDEVLAQQHSAELNRLLAEKVRSLERAEARARFHLQLTDEIRAAADAYSIQARATALLGRFVGARYALFADYPADRFADSGQDDSVLFHSCYARPGVEELRGRFAATAFAWADPARLQGAGGAPLCRQVDSVANGDAPAHAVVVPYVSKDRVAHALIVLRDLDAPWETEEVQFIADAAERIWTAVEKERAQAELREADRRKDEFLAMLAHELRNPLAPISAAAQLMGMTDLSGAQLKRTSEVIARQVRHMSELVDDLLDVSRVTQGMVKIARTPQDMGAVVRAAVEQSRPLMQARSHTLQLDLPETPCFVSGDQKRLIQVLANLLNNAAKYTPEGGRIEVRLACGDARVTLDVLDNGIGVPA